MRSLWNTYFLLALALGPQLALGFSGNLASFSSREGGLASLRIAKETEILLLECGTEQIISTLELKEHTTQQC